MTDHEKLLENGDIFYVDMTKQLTSDAPFYDWNKINEYNRQKTTMSKEERFIQWLKILGLSIALGIMVYQTYLLKIISKQ